jgi:hypothetical protein
VRKVGGAALVSAGAFRGVHGCVGEVHQVQPQTRVALYEARGCDADAARKGEHTDWPRVGQRINQNSATITPKPLAIGATTTAAG